MEGFEMTSISRKIVLYVSLILINLPLTNSSCTVMAQRQESNNCCYSIPQNIGMEGYLKIIVEKALYNSATFREQCALIGKKNNLYVEIKIMPYLPDGVKALSQIRRMSDGKIKIEVRLIPQLLSSYIEMLGHEFEHIIEQIEGVNLSQMDSKQGAFRSSNGRYETLRAIDAGHRVVLEFENSQKGVSKK
jgi:hypothetical protein